MPLPLPLETYNLWIKERNYKHALDVLYVSNLTDEIMNLPPNFFNGVFGDNCFFQMYLQEKEDENKQPWVSMNFQDGFKLKADFKIRTMVGRYLRMIFAYSHESQVPYAEDYIDQAANLLRLKYGMGAAAEKAESIIHDFVNNTYSKASNDILLIS